MSLVKAILCSLLFFFSFTQRCFAEDKGTVIVTYQTEQAKDLNRIRFWLVNENDERTLYPKKDGFVSNVQKRNERTVVISQLPLGKYRIEFSFPKGKSLFQGVEPKSIIVDSGSVTKVNQVIKKSEPLSLQNDLKSTTMIADAFTTPASPYTTTTTTITPLPPPVINTSHSRTIISSPAIVIQPGYFSLTTNKSIAWKLMNNGRVVYASSGSISNLPVRPAPNFYLLTEDVQDYSVKMSPTNPFDILPDRTTNVELFYQREMGFIDVEATLSSPDDFLIISLFPVEEDQTPLQINLRPLDGKIFWQSGPIGTGEYVISFTLPESYLPVNNQRFYIEKGKHTRLTPNLTTKGTLQVITDTPQAIYTVVNAAGAVVKQGQGFTQTFKGLDSGYYTINFSSTDNQMFTPPPPQKVFIPLNQNAKVQAAYSKSGKVTISSNLEKFKVIIQSLDSSRAAVEKEMVNHTGQLFLPEGKYRINYEAESYDLTQQKPVEVVVRTASPQNVYLSFVKPKEVHEKPKNTKPSLLKPINNESGIEIQSNILDIYLSIQDLAPNGSLKNLRGKENVLFIPIDQEGTFQIDFAPRPNYKVPKSEMIHVSGKEHAIVKVDYEPGDALLKVPAGPAVIGDPFSDNPENERPPITMLIPEFEIGSFEVTNALYARWLTDAFKRGLIKLDGEKPGHVVEATEGTLYCKTTDANPNSQIMSRKVSNEITFMPVEGKGYYPVIEVTWYGANAYCKDQGLRLPTEPQWEKAAGMEMGPSDKPLKRYKFGFVSDTIDRRWANYHDSTKPVTTLKVLTTPVGFYNGVNSLPLVADEPTQVFTKNARSPAGAYDMSGNVWEWTASWDELDSSDTHKIAKGGCYDSFVDGVRVSERLAMKPDYSDIYTGFRVAKYKNNGIVQKTTQKPKNQKTALSRHARK